MDSALSSISVNVGEILGKRVFHHRQVLIEWQCFSFLGKKNFFKPNCPKAGAKVDKCQVLGETAKDFILEVVTSENNTNNPMIRIQRVFASEHF